MTRRLWAGATLLLAATVMGCGGGDGDGARGTTASQETDAPGSTSATATTADDAAIRSYVADLAPTVADWREDYDAQPPCVAEPSCGFTESLGILSMSMIAETFTLVIDVAEQDNPPAPADVADLLTGIRDSAQSLMSAQREWTAAGCNLPSPSECDSMLRLVEVTADDVDDAVVRWETVGS